MRVVGALLGLAIVLFEWRLRRVSLKRLIGAAIGSVLGIVGAYLFALVIRNSLPPGHTQSFMQIMVMLLMAYVGLVVGANKGDLLNLAALGGIFGGREAGQEELQDPGHQRHHRRPHRRHCRDRFSRWNSRDSAVRAARTATGGGFGRLAEAQPRPARAGHSAAPAENGHRCRSRSSRMIFPPSAKWI